MRGWSEQHRALPLSRRVGLLADAAAILTPSRPPLASLFIIRGADCKLVWTIGAATLLLRRPATSLCNYIFTDCKTENGVSVLFGALPPPGLLLWVADFFLHPCEQWRLKRSRKCVVLGSPACSLQRSPFRAAALEQAGTYYHRRKSLLRPCHPSGLMVPD